MEVEPSAPGQVYLFIDEIQLVPDWQVWVKHQVDFNKDRRIILVLILRIGNSRYVYQMFAFYF